MIDIFKDYNFKQLDFIIEENKIKKFIDVIITLSIDILPRINSWDS